MCTITVIARQDGYCLGMNRDEKLTRPLGLPPKPKSINGRALLSPSEPRGGTWIALNDNLVTFALVNWYAIEARVDHDQVVSRGEIVNSARMASSPDSAVAMLAQLPVGRTNPFRLIGVFPASKEIAEWRWDLDRLVRLDHPWMTQQWISSGFDEPTAQRVRGEAFEQARQQYCVESADWLRRLHRSHSPQAGPFSTCMHRADAATVSYTEVIVSKQRATMRYHPGPPCQHAPVCVRHYPRVPLSSPSLVH